MPSSCSHQTPLKSVRRATGTPECAIYSVDSPSQRSQRLRTVVLGKVSFGVFLCAQPFPTIRVLAKALEQSDGALIPECMKAKRAASARRLLASP